MTPTPPRLEDVPLYLRTRIDIALVDAYNAAVQMGAPHNTMRATPDPLPELAVKRKHRRAETVKRVRRTKEEMEPA